MQRTDDWREMHACLCCDWVSRVKYKHFFFDRLLQLLYDSATIKSDDDVCDGADNYLKAAIDIESLLDNSFFNTDDLMAFTDRAKLEQTELWVHKKTREENK